MSDDLPQEDGFLELPPVRDFLGHNDDGRFDHLLPELIACMGTVYAEGELSRADKLHLFEYFLGLSCAGTHPSLLELSLVEKIFRAVVINSDGMRQSCDIALGRCTPEQIEDHAATTALNVHEILNGLPLKHPYQ